MHLLTFVFISCVTPLVAGRPTAAQLSPNAKFQTRGPAMTIPEAQSLSTVGELDSAARRQPGAPGNPEQRRDCLERHRFFPLPCAMARLRREVSPPPECRAVGGHDVICQRSREVLVRREEGWHCACDGPRDAPGHPRGLHARASAAEDHALAPDCIDIRDVERAARRIRGNVV